MEVELGCLEHVAPDLENAGRAAAVVVDIDSISDDGSALDGSTFRDNVKTDIENVTGGNGADALTGSSANNVFDGGNAADTFNGLGGTDTVTYAGRAAAVGVAAASAIHPERGRASCKSN